MSILGDDEADVREFGREDHGRILPIPESEGFHANEILVAVLSNDCVGYEIELVYRRNIDATAKWLKERLRERFRVLIAAFKQHKVPVEFGFRYRC